MPSQFTLSFNVCICGDLNCKIPYGYCHCGCNQKTPLSRVNFEENFQKKNEPMRYLQGHSNSRKHTLPAGMCICRDTSCTIPYGLCHCGCGTKTTIALNSNTKEGTINGMPRRYKEGHTCKTTTVIARLTEHKIIDEGRGCWLWRKARDKDGYGLIKIKNVMCRVHIVSYETFVGKVPEGLIVRHKCDNPPCFNPEHLETGTQKDNRRDAFERGRITADMMKEWFKKRVPRKRKGEI